MLSLWTIISSLAGCIILSVIARRLVYSKLAKYPGPVAAACTGLYRAYYDVVKSGGLLVQLEILHKKYGPVVRIGPNELHFQSPSAYFDIYNHGNLTKEPTLYNSFPFHDASISFVNRQDAALRRELLGPMFSRSAILDFENVVQEKINSLIAKLQQHTDAVDFHMAARSATIDIIAQYCFGASFDALEFKRFQHPILVGLQTGVTASWILKYVPVMLKAIENAPEFVIDRLPQENQFFRDMRIYASEQIRRHTSNLENLDMAEQKTIFHHLMSSLRQTPSTNSLMGETMALLAAGHDTVGGAFTVGTYHILSNQNICSRLVNELLDIWPDSHSQLSYQQLEKLPYLTAVIKESLRLSHGVVSNLPRVTGEPMSIGGYIVPENTIVSTSAVFIHWNSDIFPDPLVFNPERWMQSNSSELSKYLVSFSRGSRMCLGINLAWCELYLLFGHIFRRLDLTPVNIDGDRDYKSFRDFFIPVWNGNRLHVKVNTVTQED